MINASNNDDTAVSIAIISYGLVRSAAQPQVAASFALMTESLTKDNNVYSFMLLHGDGTHDHDVTGDLKHKYNLTELWIITDQLECNRKCDIICTGGHDQPFQLLQQFYNGNLAYDKVSAWERDKAIQFSWYLKVRPDLLWLEPFPPLSGFSADRIYVPHGVMSKRHEFQHLNDHVMLCPRRLCAPYFKRLIDQYRGCSGRSLHFPYPPQKAVFDDAYGRPEKGGGARVFEVAYTIARESGPECARLVCGPKPINMGCEATHLNGFFDACNTADKMWETRTMFSMVNGVVDANDVQYFDRTY